MPWGSTAPWPSSKSASAAGIERRSLGCVQEASDSRRAKFASARAAIRSRGRESAPVELDLEVSAAAARRPERIRAPCDAPMEPRIPAVPWMDPGAGGMQNNY
eukprot:TRINITY_DN34578_c0_g1_i1.p2 TRINITY_DN34578_c0_g1~~TRINITY_DN34578_c0_g1_i1.p2  ORF type:complete len:103 (+),score=9.38 TRINITY_DN34578_c0_g1_i1:94-402(+)